MSFVTGPHSNLSRNKTKHPRPNISSPIISHPAPISNPIHNYLEDIPDDLPYKDIPAIPSRTLPPSPPSPPSNLHANQAHPNSLGPLISHQSPEPSSREAPLSPSSRPAPRNIRQELAPTPDLLSPRSSNDFEDVNFEYQGSSSEEKGKGKGRTASGVPSSYMGELGQFNNPAFETGIGRGLESPGEDPGFEHSHDTVDEEGTEGPRFDLRRATQNFLGNMWGGPWKDETKEESEAQQPRRYTVWPGHEPNLPSSDMVNHSGSLSLRYRVLISLAFVLALGAAVFSGLAFFKATHAPTSVRPSGLSNATETTRGTATASSSVSIAPVVVSTMKSLGSGVMTRTKGPVLGVLTPSTTAMGDRVMTSTFKSQTPLTVIVTRPQISASAMSTHQLLKTLGITKHDQGMDSREEAIAMETMAYWDATSTVTVTHVSTAYASARGGRGA